MNNELKAHLQVVLATLIVAGSFIATANISDQLHPISLNLMRFCIAALALAPFVLFKKNPLKKLIRVMPRSLVISFFYSGYFACHFISMLSTSALNVGSLFTLTPLITALLSIFFFKQKLTVTSLFIYLLGMMGTIWVIFEGNYQLLSQLALNKGDLIFSLGVLFMGGFTISMKLLYRGDDVTIMTFGNLLGGVIWMFIAALALGVSLNWQSFDYQYFPSMAYLALAATFITSYLYQKASTVLKPINVSAYIYLNPLCVALMAIVVFKESVAPIIWIGIGASTLATLILQYLANKNVALTTPDKSTKTNKEAVITTK